MFFLPHVHSGHRHHVLLPRASSLPPPIRATRTNVDLNRFIGTGPFKGENIHVGQLSFYAQDEFLADRSPEADLGLRVDFPMYFTDPVDNPFSRGLTALDENRNPEDVDQSKLPGAKPLFSPRFGFNWNAFGRPPDPDPRRHRRLHRAGAVRVDRERDLQPGREPEPVPPTAADPGPRGDGSILAAVVRPELDGYQLQVAPGRGPRDLAIDQRLPWGLLATLEVIYGKDLQQRLRAKCRPASRR